MKKDSGGKYVIGALIGAVAGAVAGVLFAPKSGKETRKIIKDKAVEIKDQSGKYVADKSEEIKSAVKGAVEKVTNKGEENAKN